MISLKKTIFPPVENRCYEHTFPGSDRQIDLLRRILCTFVLTFCFWPLCAPNLWEGWVAEKGTEKPIENIWVSLFREDQSFITYGRTDTQEQFTISYSGTPAPLYTFSSH